MVVPSGIVRSCSNFELSTKSPGLTEATTSISVYNSNRKFLPSALRGTHVLRYTPGAVGAFRFNAISAVTPGPTDGKGKVSGPSIFSSPAKARTYPVAQVDWPVLRTRQILFIICPGCTRVPSSKVTSSTYVSSSNSSGPS